MSDKTVKKISLFKVGKELNVKTPTLVQHLKEKGFEVEDNLNAKLSDDMYMALLDKFAAERAAAERHHRWENSQAELKQQEEAEKVAQTEAERLAQEAAEEAARIEAERIAKEAAEEVARIEAERLAQEAAERAAAEAVKIEAERIAKAAAAVAAAAAARKAAKEGKLTENVVPKEVAKEKNTEVTKKQEVQPVQVVSPTVVESPKAVELPKVVELPKAVEVPEVKAEIQVPVVETPVVEVNETIRANRHQLDGLNVLGKIDLSTLKDKDTPSAGDRRKKRKRKTGDPQPQVVKVDAKKIQDSLHSENRSTKGKPKTDKKKQTPVVSNAAVTKTVQETLQELKKGASDDRKAARNQRKIKRVKHAERVEEEAAAAEVEAGILRVTEFISAAELAGLMDVSVNEIIMTCMQLSMMVSINQRLDADTISLIGDSFGFQVEFIKEIGSDDYIIEEDKEEDKQDRAPIVTIMGHVDHGKTSLLDYIRSSSVATGEAGGITQHIGAYEVTLASGKKIAFLDTPGHEAFTAMRARGAQVTDVVIIVVAADDAVMPQTIEAINHAKAAGVPMIVAVNKIDKPGVNTDKVLQELSVQNVLVEQWGGNVQCSFISAKKGTGIEDLLEKVVLEADVLELKANPNRTAIGTVIESRLDKGRGTVATILVQNGTLKVGDVFVAGPHFGRVRAMFDENEQKLTECGPSKPAQILGFQGSPEVGDRFIVFTDEAEGKAIASKRAQIQREQSLRARKHITLDEIGRRLALGEFKELNVIIKADVQGSAQALTDSLLKLSHNEVQVNVIHSGVGAISASDVTLASASDAVIIGFQVRPATVQVRKMAETEEIDIRLYSVIYDAIEDVRDALEGLLSPEESEKILGLVEVRETFKVPKIGTVAGCYVMEGKIKRSDFIRVIREGVVIYEGKIGTLRRFKDDVKEVASGYECGLNIDGFNNIEVGDHIEPFEIVQTKRKL